MKVFEPLPDGRDVHLTATDEGVIIDVHNNNTGASATFSNTWNELADLIQHLDPLFEEP